MAVFDYSTARPDPSLLDEGALRYLCLLPNPKALDASELASLWAAGKPVGLVWEQDASDYIGGHAQGVTYGTEARRQARLLGFPDPTPIYWSVDARLNDAQRFVAVNYGQGFTEAAGVARPYGEAALIDAAVAAGLCDMGWCPETWGSSTHLCLVQQVNNPSPVPGTDWNVTFPSVDWGGYLPGVDMTDDQAGQLANVQNVVNGHTQTLQLMSAALDQIKADIAALQPSHPGSSFTGSISGTIQ